MMKGKSVFDWGKEAYDAITGASSKGIDLTGSDYASNLTSAFDSGSQAAAEANIGLDAFGGAGADISSLSAGSISEIGASAAGLADSAYGAGIASAFDSGAMAAGEAGVGLEVFGGAGADIAGGALAAEGVAEGMSLMEMAPVLSAAICTESHKQGLLKQGYYQAEALHLQKHPLADSTRRGYHFFAIPIVKQMRRSTRVAKFFAAFANAFIAQTALGKKSVLGTVITSVLLPLCTFVGTYFVRDDIPDSVFAEGI